LATPPSRPPLVIYTDWDIDQLAATMADVLAQENDE
jgi:hypothetical protein